jgi:GntR family transcriptional regulator
MGGAVRPRPRVDAVRATLRSWIGSGRLRRGRQLPPEPELAAELGVSRATLREALRSLEDEGLLTRTRGAGTFLATGHRLRNNLDANFGVTEAIRSAGMRPGFVHATVRSGPAGAEEAERLDLSPADEVVTVERVRTADGRRVVHSVDVIPAWLVGDGSDLRRRLARGSLYELFEKELGVAIHHGVASFGPARATRVIAEKLRVPRGALLLYLHQVDYDEAGRPVMSSHEHHLADAFEFMVVRRGPGRRFA